MYKVVIIDDEPWTRNVIKSLGNWEKLGLEVVGEASDGEMGWSLVKNLRPDIVITDVRMPRLGGLDLVQLMREEAIPAPAIVISGYEDYEYVHRALKLGVVDYLLKPIKPEELNQQLENGIRQLESRAGDRDFQVKVAFPPDSWSKDFYKILEDMEIQLRLGKEEELSQLLAGLEELLDQNEGAQPAQFIQIGVYYSLIDVLQRYIMQSGYQKKEVFEGMDEVYVFGRDSDLCQILSFVKTLYEKAVGYIKEHETKKNRMDTDSVCRYLEEHYKEGVTLEEVADYFHISKEYLSKLFKMEQKIGFSDYILKLRMEKAKELIQVYRAPLKEVGAMVGYMDQAHFYKNFKKYYGITPGDMRESLKCDNK
ncbi:MAG: response regulator [Acetatifactor sp.]|nr:response regulator [Acetatifactor sp.]